MADRPEPLQYVEAALKRPGRGAWICFVAALVAGAWIGLDLVRPEAFQDLPQIRSIAWLILIAAPIIGVVLALLHYSTSASKMEPIPDFQVPTLAKPSPPVDPEIRPQIVTNLSEPSPGTPRARFEAAAKAARTEEEQRKLDGGLAKKTLIGSSERPIPTQYNIKLPQERAQARADAAASTPPDASIWAKAAGETRVVMPEETAFPIPETGSVQVIEPWLREVYVNGNQVRAGIASGETISVPAGDVLLETRDSNGRVDFRKRLHVRSGSIYTDVRLDRLEPESGVKVRSIRERLDALLPRSRDYLRYLKAKALLQIEVRISDPYVRDLVEHGFLNQIRQTPSGIGTYLVSELTSEVYPLLNPDIIIDYTDGVPPWERQ